MTPDLGLADSLVTAMVILSSVGSACALGIYVIDRTGDARTPRDPDGAPLFRRVEPKRRHARGA